MNIVKGRKIVVKDRVLASVPRSGGVPLSHNQLVALDVETRARRRPGIGIAHRRRARLHNERPQPNAADPHSPLAAPIYADLTGLAPLLVQVGAAETLLDDAIRLARVAGAADVRVDLQILPEMIHVWHLFHPELKAGQRGIEEGGAFVRAHTAEKFA